MKRALIALAVGLCLALTVVAQAKSGPIVDKIIFDARMDRTIGIKDAAAGNTDIFWEQLNGANFKAISAEDLAKLDVYQAPSGYWDIALNPVPNKAPFQTVSKDGTVQFNPFAIREVRFALNLLFDRKKIVDEILLGVGVPALSAFPPGQPGTYKYNLIPAKLGITARGNEDKAIKDITAAMEAAANLPENAGKLAKSGQFWTFNGKPIMIKFMMRVDDPTGRLPSGHYMADQIEKAGLKVDRLEWNRTKCLDTQNKTDPADLQWSVYTEGWGGGGTNAWWDNNVSQYYAPWRGYMAGGGTAGFWQYENKEIDDLSKIGYNGWFVTADDYWNANLKAAEIGIKEANRIFIAQQAAVWVANKARFSGRMAYGLGDGLDPWSVRTADVKPNANGEKILHITQYSSQGGLFMSAWDPIGQDGFTDLYSTNIYANATDRATFQFPLSAKVTALRTKWDQKNYSVSLKADPKGGKPIGLIPVPSNAVIFNAKAGKWESGVEYKDMDGKGTMDFVKNANITSYSKLVNVSYVGGKWHDGNTIGIADTMYATAFAFKWANKIGDNDKQYDEAYASAYQGALVGTKGMVLNKDGSFDVYYDTNFPMEPANAAGAGAGIIDVVASHPGSYDAFPWQIYEAVAKLVTDGSASKTVYGFAADESITEPDVVNPKCVADIRAKLQEMADAKYVPAWIVQWCTADQAVARYKASIAFIDKYGNAFVSNGPFFFSKINYDANYIEMSAFRDYPIKSDWLPKLLTATITRVDEVKAPATASKSKDATIDIAVSAVAYPADTAKAADAKTKVTLTLIAPDNSEKIYTAKFVKAGSFQVIVPAKDLAALKTGNYNLVVQSVLADESPSVSTTSMVLF